VSILMSLLIRGRKVGANTTTRGPVVSSHIHCTRCDRTHSLQDGSPLPLRCPACGADAIPTPQPPADDAWWIGHAPPAPTATQVAPPDALTAAPRPMVLPPLPRTKPVRVPIGLLAGGGFALLVLACTLMVLAVPSRKTFHKHQQSTQATETEGSGSS